MTHPVSFWLILRLHLALPDSFWLSIALRIRLQSPCLPDKACARLAASLRRNNTLTSPEHLYHQRQRCMERELPGIALSCIDQTSIIDLATSFGGQRHCTAAWLL